MKLQKNQNGNRVVLSVEGTIDTETSQELGRALLELDYSDLDLTLDFTNTKYITSAGLRVLLVARKKLTNDTMRIVGVNDEIAEVFAVTGFDEILNFTKSRAVNMGSYHLSFKELLKKKTDECADRTAFVYMGRDYSWADVDKASQIIAGDLSAMGVRKGSHVGICSPNSVNWVFAFYAVQKLGGIAVLINFLLNPAEIVTLAEIGGITHLCYGSTPGMTDYEHCASAVTASGSMICETYNIGNEVDFTARYSEYDSVKDWFSETYHADDASVIIFTSGSTGRPKAVLSSSYNLLSCMVPFMEEFHLTPDDRNCAFLPFFHVFGFCTSIAVGLLTDIISYIPEDNRPQTMLNVIEKYRCTLFHSVPTMVLMMTQLPEFSSGRVSSLRVSALGGSATSEAQMNALRRLFPNNHFSNVYGMSESAAISITDYEDTVEHITQTVGRPVDGMEIKIRDAASGEEVPDGQPGEVCIRSKTMIVCYYKLSIEKQPLDDDGWLATGDLGMLDPDGYLRLVGRVKDLIIRGGENISPGEVAEAIAFADDIADVKVIGVPDETYGEEVAAAVIMKPGKTLDEAAMRDFLDLRIAKFKIPSYFVVFESFPMLGSGKIDAIKLREDVLSRIKKQP